MNGAKSPGKAHLMKKDGNLFVRFPSQTHDTAQAFFPAWSFFTSSKESPQYSEIFSGVSVPSNNSFPATAIRASFCASMHISSTILHISLTPFGLSPKFILPQYFPIFKNSRRNKFTGANHVTAKFFISYAKIIKLSPLFLY